MTARLTVAVAGCAAVLTGAAMGWRAARGALAGAPLAALGSTGYFKAIPANAVLFAPNIGDGRTFSGMAGHAPRVVETGKQASEMMSQGVPVYYCERQWLPGRRDSVLLVSQFSAPLASDLVTLVATRELPHVAIEYGCPGLGAERAVAGICEAAVGAWRQDGRAFLAEATVPGWTPGDSRLLDEETGAPVQVAVAVDFGRGFWENTEHSGGHYFRWSDGADGEAELDLVNSLDRPLAARFRAVLQFNPAAKTGAFDITTPSGKQSLRLANGGILELALMLRPGSNPIVVDCHEGRIPVAGDPRQMVFSVRDWSIEPVRAEGVPPPEEK